MKIGLIGLPQTGKKTLFTLLTGHRLSEKDLASNKPIKGIAQIKDPRFDRLAETYKPKKEVRAKIEVELLPKLDKESIRQGGIFKDIVDADAICHVVRAFKNDAVYHINGSVDPKRDIDEINSELLLNDLAFIEKRVERIDKTTKSAPDAAIVKEKELLLKFKSQIDKGLPLRLIDVKPQEKHTIASYPLITLKEMIVVLNCSEEDLKNTVFVEQLKNEYRPVKIDVMQVSAKVESEIAALESEKDREVFLKELGVKEPAIDVLTRVCMKALNLASFFTVGHDEVRQWTIKAHSSAPEAAGAIHTDLQKGFIRAEVIKYNDLVALGNEEKVKEAGKLYIKGKDYIVEDGDILNIRFNV